jgi:pimeloyl-ACP methyl ester carboxylesterase
MWLLGGTMRLMERTPPGVLHTDLRACNDWQHGLDDASAVRCASLVVVGARDLMAPPRAAKELIAKLKQPRVVTLADCGHAMMAEQPDAVLDALRAFVPRGA